MSMARLDPTAPSRSVLIPSLGGIVVAVALASCGFPEFGGFIDTGDASLGGAGGNSGAAGTGGDSGDGGDDAGTGGDSSAGQGGGGDGGSDAQAGGDGGDAGPDGDVEGGGDGEAGTGGDAEPPDAQPDVVGQPPLNTWHIPTEPEPPTVTMRNPLYPAAGGEVFIYFGVNPIGASAGGTLYWWWTGETTPHEVPFAWDSNDSGKNNDYWVASFDMPQHAVGTFRYFIDVRPTDTASFSTTYLYGSDTATNKAVDRPAAEAAPYLPTTRAPVVGEIVITEIMANPFGGTSTVPPEREKEWFELYCAATVPILLHGTLLADGSAATPHTISAPELILWPGTYATFGSSGSADAMDGFTPDYNYAAAFQLNNTVSGGVADTVKVLLPTSEVINSVTFGTGWPPVDSSGEGHSMQYTVQPPDATQNAAASNWCLSQRVYGTGISFGTPNQPTDNCAP